jgi:hypothetical protein
MEKFQAWTHSSAALPEDAIDRDTLLTNVMSHGPCCSPRRR